MMTDKETINCIPFDALGESCMAEKDRVLTL